ncbi:hypothetical protein, partial [Acetobacterium wieringae]|uniref:hypothetical protein n=1 Tax=Acetobacterium wieringae TaxID=52694 RepID=UPI001A9A58B0
PFRLIDLFLSNSILSQSGEELYFFRLKISRYYAGFGVLQTPKFTIVPGGDLYLWIKQAKPVVV